MPRVRRTHGHSIDEYLEVIYFLVSPVGELAPYGGSTAIAARVADALGVSRAAVGEMLKRMTAEGLLDRRETRELRLTPAGTERAEQVVRRHRILERFLTDYLGYTPAESHGHADALTDTFDDDMVERIHARLGHPDRCPHGWPVDPAVEREENATLVSLSELAAGERAEVVRLTEQDGELLHWFYDAGLVPGSRLEVRDVQPSAGHRTVAMDEATPRDQVIADKAARNLLVRRA
jgi:DtxR family Mn-dependent transcriptional regulator